MPTNIGGSEILRVNTEFPDKNPWFDWGLIGQFDNMLYIKLAIIALLILITIMLILRIYRIKTLTKPKGLVNELNTINAMRQRDAFILQANKFTSFATNIIEKTMFKANKANKDYMEYNLKRANIRTLGGMRPMTSEEFNALVKVVTLVFIGVGIGTGLLVSKTVGVIIVAVSIWLSTVLPMLLIRNIVKSRNATIVREFFNVYCKLHYSLMSGGVTPINKLLQIYAKTTDDPEMLRFVDNCVNTIETYNEYAATTIIADDYREVAEVGKLMRLVKQQADGADIKAELIGFREELIEKEKYRLSVMVDKDIAKVKRSFTILGIMLAQAVISAASIYMPDMSQLAFF